MKPLRTVLLCALAAIPALAQTSPAQTAPPQTAQTALAQAAPAQPAQTAPAQAATPCAGLPSGKHSLLERFTAAFGLTCEQQLKVEPLLHAEESVSKPLLAFAAFTPEEQQGVMLKIKLAARRQVRGLLTTEQQGKMDSEMESTANAGTKIGGKKGTAKKAPAKVDAFQNEEDLSNAIQNYAALQPAEKTAMILQAKQAARRDNPLELTADQQKKIDADIKQLTGK